MTNLDLQIEEAYRRGRDQFPARGQGASLADAKVKAHDDYRAKQSKPQCARKKAVDFATPLFDMEPHAGGKPGRSWPKRKGLTVEVTAPFDRDNGPKRPGRGPRFRQQSVCPDAGRPVCRADHRPDAVYVIALNKKLPSRIPALDQIRAQVVKDYKHNQALTLARKAGMEFYPTLTNGLAQGKPFASICLNASSNPWPVPPFSLSTRELPEVGGSYTLNQFKQIAFRHAAGQAQPLRSRPAKAGSSFM